MSILIIIEINNVHSSGHTVKINAENVKRRYEFRKQSLMYTFFVANSILNQSLECMPILFSKI